MKRFFHSELDNLKSHLLLMGEKANDAVGKAILALQERDVDLAMEVVKGDDDIDQLEIEIDRESTRYLTLRSPVASDLRLITVAIKASHDLERVGDEARNIAKRTRKMVLKSGLTGDLLNIPDMTAIARDMLRDALQCFIQEEPQKAQAVLTKDEEVDQLNKANFKQFIQMAKNEPEDINRYLDLIFISKSLERIADHATNLAEEVIYLMTAEEARHQ
ncbi:MAG: phosphate signaling complex protein PhoU [Oceanipulchritudo sp.]